MGVFLATFSLAAVYWADRYSSQIFMPQDSHSPPTSSSLVVAAGNGAEGEAVVL